MPTATNTHITPTRRSALGFSAAAIVAGFTMPVIASTKPDPDADAELIALCSEFHEVHSAWYARTDHFSDAWEAMGVHRWAISNKLQDIPPQTDSGRLAKARVAFVVLHENVPDSDDRDSVIDLVYAALRDIVGSAVA
jgi:hypothetical protein